MKQENIVSICILMFLIMGYALYVYPKNYEILEIDAKNSNYSVVGLTLGWLAMLISLFAIIVFKGKKSRVIFGIEVIMSIALLLLWNRY